jgi:hypothetical protein
MRAKHLILVLSLGLLISCASTKANQLEENGLNTSEPMGVEGIITNNYREQGCAFLFEFTDPEGNERLVRPLQLDEEFKKDGLKVRIDFRMSRASNDGCDLAHPVIVESIEKI